MRDPPTDEELRQWEEDILVCHCGDGMKQHKLAEHTFTPMENPDDHEAILITEVRDLRRALAYAREMEEASNKGMTAANNQAIDMAHLFTNAMDVLMSGDEAALAKLIQFHKEERAVREKMINWIRGNSKE